MVCHITHATPVVGGIRGACRSAITFKRIVPITAILLLFTIVVEIGSAEPLSSVTEWQTCVVACGDPGA